MSDYEIQPDYPHDVIKRSAINILRDGLLPDPEKSYDLVIFSRSNIANIIDQGQLGTSFIIIEGIDNMNFADIGNYVFNFLNQFKVWSVYDWFSKIDGTSVIILSKQQS